MEQKTERGWKLIVCPQSKERVPMMCEWEIVSRGGQILEKTLRQIDCRHPQLTRLDGADCSWTCEEIILRRRRRRRSVALQDGG